jgi:hypothetical protein
MWMQLNPKGLISTGKHVIGGSVTRRFLSGPANRVTEYDVNFVLLEVFALLACYSRLLVTDIAGQPIGPTVKGRDALDCLTLEYGADRLYRNVGNCQFTLRSVDSSNPEDGADRMSRNVGN